MDLQIINTAAGTLTYLATVDKRFLDLLKKPEQSGNAILTNIHHALKKLRATLVSLSTAMRKPEFNKSLLKDIKTLNATLFQYITTVLLATINGLRKLESQVKKSTGGGKKFSFGKKPKAAVVIDDDIAIFEDRVRHYDLSLQVAINIIDWYVVEWTDINPLRHANLPFSDIAALAAKVHVHGFKLAVHKLSETIADLQTVNLNVSITEPPKIDGKVETIFLTNFNGITSNATELAKVAAKRTDDEMTKIHNGFVPMSPLIEVASRYTLQPCPTIVSVMELEK